MIWTTRRTLHFWNHIIANNNAHSFACVLLFPKSTKYLLGAPDLRYRAVAITLRQILILRLVSQKPRLKWWFCGYCVIPCNALYVIARSNATWQSPGRVTLLIIWWFLSNCQKDTLVIIYNRCVLININTREYDVKI